MSARITTQLSILMTMLLVGCAPKKADSVATDAPPPSMEPATTSNLDTHHRQVQQDVDSFLAHRTQQNTTETTIEWNLPEEKAASETEADMDIPPVATVQNEPPYGPVEEGPTPEVVPTSVDLNQSMINFSRELYVSSTWSDQPIRELLVLASLSMLDPDRAIDPDAIPDLTEDERELLKTMQQYFISIGTELEPESNPWRVASIATAELEKRLKRTPELKLPTIALCTRVGGFGDFDEWDIHNEAAQYSFVAHTSQPVIIYLEMEGFSSKLNPNDLWETVTSQHLTIYSDRDGIPVWKEDWQSAADRSRKQRRDYFTVQKLTIPRSLSIGRYQLKIRVRDEKTGAEAEHNIPFIMTAGVMQ